MPLGNIVSGRKIMTKEIAMSKDEVQSHFLRVRLARLSIFQMLGTIERWIRWRILNSTTQQLFHAETELMDKMREVQEGKASLAAVHKAWSIHPLQKLLFEERVRREYQLESSSEDYLGHLGNGLSTTDIQDYLIWKGEKHGTVQDWVKEKKRTLPVVTNETKEVKTSDRRVSISGEGIYSPGSDLPSSPKGPFKTPIKGESKAYGPRRKR